MRSAIVAVIAALTLARPIHAFAQPSPPPDPTAIFKEGRAVYDRGEYRRALDLFRESYKLAPADKILANLARTEGRLGMYGSAMRHFQEVVSRLPETDPLRAAIVGEVIQLAPKVPYLRVSLKVGAPAETRVGVDGEALSRDKLGKDVPIDPGKHVVTAAAPGMKDRRYEVPLREGEHREIVVEMERLPAAPPSPPVSVAKPPTTAAAPVAPLPLPQTPASPQTEVEPPITLGYKLGIAALGVGGAAMLVGVGTGLRALDKKEDLTSQCRAPSDCPASAQPVINEMNTLSHVATPLLIVGGAVLTTGAVLFFRSPRGRIRPKPRVDPMFGAASGGGWLGAQGSF